MLTITQGLAIVGALALFQFLFQFLVLMKKLLVQSSGPSVAMGSWAIVTGASDGIGKEFASQLAARQFNVVLMSRSKDKLEKLATEIEEKYSIKTLVYPFDFSQTDPSKWKLMASALQKLDIGVLINNVAMNHAFPTPFLEEDDTLIQNILQVNIHAMMKMTKIVLPGMISKKAGLVLNVGSMAGKVPSALLATYSATKSFLRTFSQALAYEVPKGVHIEHINTYFVVTNMSKIRKPNMMTPTARDYVKSVLNQTGQRISSTPYPTHAMGEWLLDRFVPESLLIYQSAQMHRDIRKRALAKLAREKKQSMLSFHLWLENFRGSGLG